MMTGALPKAPGNEPAKWHEYAPAQGVVGQMWGEYDPNGTAVLMMIYRNRVCSVSMRDNTDGLRIPRGSTVYALAERTPGQARRLLGTYANFDQLREAFVLRLAGKPFSAGTFKAVEPRHFVPVRRPSSSPIKLAPPIPRETKRTVQNGGLFTPKTKKLAWRQCEGRCKRCDKELTPGVDVAYDHIIPWSSGGSNTIENCAVLCTSCNCSKGARVVSRMIPPRTSFSMYSSRASR